MCSEDNMPSVSTLKDRENNDRRSDRLAKGNMISVERCG